MSLVTEIQTRLRANATITALVETQRIKEQWIAQGELHPTITLGVTDHQHGHDLGGGGGYAEPLLEIHVWTRTSAHKDTIGEAIRQSLQGFSGTLTTIVVRGIVLESDREFYESSRVGGQDGFYHRVMQFKVFHTETIPTNA